MKNTIILALVASLVAGVISYFYYFENNNFSVLNLPEVTIISEAKDHPGQEMYLNLVKEQGYNSIEEWVQHCCIAVTTVLYSDLENANEKGLQRITYKLLDEGPISYKGGAAPEIEIGFNLNHLVEYYKEHGKIVAMDEIYGILCHEITHGYQNEPKNAGGYAKDTEFFGFIEGSADLVRLETGGFNPPRTPEKGGNYTSGYTTTGFFYQWIQMNYHKSFIKELNQTAANYEIWTFDKACQDILNKTASELWEEYQNSLDL